MYGRIYNVIAAPTSQTVAIDLFEIVAPSTGVVILRALRIGQTTEIGDAQDEQCRVRIITGYTTSGSGGSSATPTPKSLGMSAFGGTAEVHNTTLANTGTAATHLDDVWNLRGGYIWMPAEEDMIVLRPSERAVVTLPALTDATTIGGTLTIEEIG